MIVFLNDVASIIEARSRFGQSLECTRTREAQIFLIACAGCKWSVAVFGLSGMHIVQLRDGKNQPYLLQL